MLCFKLNRSIADDGLVKRQSRYAVSTSIALRPKAHASVF